MKHKFNTLRLRPTLRKNRENFTILGLTETLRKASEILINAILTKTTENLNAWRVVKISARADHRQAANTLITALYICSKLEAGSWKQAGSWRN